MSSAAVSSYYTVYQAAKEDPEKFWGQVAEAIHWTRPWDRVLDDSDAPFYRWFTGGELNTCYNALDLHVEQGRGDQAALVYDSAVTDTRRSYSFSELRDTVALFAAFVAALFHIFCFVVDRRERGSDVAHRRTQFPSKSLGRPTAERVLEVVHAAQQNHHVRRLSERSLFRSREGFRL